MCEQVVPNQPEPQLNKFRLFSKYFFTLESFWAIPMV